MHESSPRWHTITPSDYAWAREAIAYVRDGMPERSPFQAWALAELVADDGSINELGLLVLGSRGLPPLEIKSWPGRIDGDTHTWAWTDPEGRVRLRDNPRILRKRKVQRLRSALERHLPKDMRLPWIEALVFLSGRGLEGASSPSPPRQRRPSTAGSRRWWQATAGPNRTLATAVSRWTPRSPPPSSVRSTSPAAACPTQAAWTGCWQP